MADKTKIEWADATWNPVTGCLHKCKYCYARRIAERFGGASDRWTMPEHNQWETISTGKNHALDKQIYDTDRGRNAPYPYYFDPTLHYYRLGWPMKLTKPRTIFVCSMADLFGKWVPYDWINAVFDACRKAPQHRYLFLTKCPIRYNELDFMALLPHEENFWYGTSVTTTVALVTHPGNPRARINTFWSMEPLLGSVNLDAAKDLPGWVIIGAETGNRREKVIPQKDWIDDITEFCDDNRIPVFMKDSLIPIVGEENMRREFPWEREETK